jgi:leucine dehydrogenase
MKFLKKKLSVPGYEEVLHIEEKESGLEAIIAIHDTRLGPALGGTRIFPYRDTKEALTDVLRLSQGMTYKSAMAQSGFGGGKSVIVADPKTERKKELLKAFALAVDELEGRYICAEDVGCSPEDVMVIRQTTQYVVGLLHEKSSGNPSPFTAWGVFRGIQAVLKGLDGSDSLQGKTVAIQGMGSVGTFLADYLFWAGAHLIVSDIDPKRTEKLALKYGAKVVSPEEILYVPCDVLSPCAMGGILHQESIRKLRCRGIAGATNNQLLEESDGDLLQQRGILYAPDFVINAGGLINVALELAKEGYSAISSRKKIDQIHGELMNIFALAKKKGVSTYRAVQAIVEERLEKKIGLRKEGPYFHHVLEPKEEAVLAAK